MDTSNEESVTVTLQILDLNTYTQIFNSARSIYEDEYLRGMQAIEEMANFLPSNIHELFDFDFKKPDFNWLKEGF